MKTEQEFILEAAIALFAMDNDVGQCHAFDLAKTLNEERKKRGYLFDHEKQDG